MTLNDSDSRLVSRFVDGEMDATERAAFCSRLDDDVELTNAVTEAREVVRWFAERRSTERDEQLSSGFEQRVLTEVRRLPSRAQLLSELAEPGEEERDSARAHAVVRRILVAAVLLFSISVLTLAGVLKFAPEPNQAKAAAQELRELDRRIDAERARETGPVEERKR